MKKRDPLLDPLPKWRQRQAWMVAWWHRSRDKRQAAFKTFKSQGRKGLTLAISMVGAILVSYCAWLIYTPAGYGVGGLLLWAIQWNYGNEEGDG